MDNSIKFRDNELSEDGNRQKMEEQDEFLLSSKTCLISPKTE